MPKLALGLIETMGLTAAIEAADAAVKAANVVLIGYELSRGSGLVTVKLEGDVGAVKAAVEAGSAAAGRVNKVYGKHVIPRPHEELDNMIYSRETVGAALQPEEPEQSEVNKDTAELMEVEVEEKECETEPKTDEVEKEIEDSPIQNTEKDDGSKKSEKELCNLCFDPLCPRKKGELKSTCIHYEELKEV